MHDTDEAMPRAGHNAPAGRAVQWQTPHLPARPAVQAKAELGETDLDLVEAAFDEGFRTAGDPVSFLRLAGISLTLTLEDGRTAHLLRVEQEERVDVAAVAPRLGGGHTVRPLPARLVGRRRQLRFVYQADDDAPVVLGFLEARVPTTSG